MARLLASAIFDDAVRPALKTAIELVRQLGGYGRAHIVLRIFGEEFDVRDDGRSDGSVPTPPRLIIGRGYTQDDVIRTWTDDEGTVTDSQVARMRRESVRACGLVAWEPSAQAQE